MKKSKIIAFHEQIFHDHIKIEKAIEPYLEIQKEQLKNHDNAILLDLSNQAITSAKKLDLLLENGSQIHEKNLLFGIPFSLKDNFSTAGIITTGGSQFLKNYLPSFSATVYVKLIESYALCLAKTNMDEFGLGGTGTFSGFGIVKNPFDETKISGGSSSGSAVSVAKGASIFSIGTDTGDSIRKPASYLGIVGYKPTYGIISRFGVFPYSPSLDHVGILSTSVTDTAIVLDSLVDFDEKDFSSQKIDKNFYKKLEYPKKIKVVILEDVFSGLKAEFHESFKKLIKKISSDSRFEITYTNFDINLLKMIDSIYQIISYSEAVSSWNNLNGILFGNNQNIVYENYEDLMHQLRTKYLGSQLKKRFVIGNWCTSDKHFDDTYLKARRLIKIINAKTKLIFSEHDVILIPGASDIAPDLEDVLKNQSATNYCDDALQIANFGGFPSITIPFINLNNKNYLGLNLFSNNFEDQKLLNIALLFETLIAGEKYE